MAKSFYVRIKHSVNYIIKNLEKIIFFFIKKGILRNLQARVMQGLYIAPVDMLS